MKSLRFKQLDLIANSRKLGNRFTFQSNLNLITGKDNDIGKSSLVKALFWVLGCEPFVDEDWKSTDCRAILDFSVGDDDYSVARYKDTIYLKEGDGDYEKFSKVTGEYAERFSKIVRFSVLLPSRAKDKEVARLEVPPPAYYFLPYYLDQKKTWAQPWCGFNKLAQYAAWQQTIIKYHTGYLSNEHFDIEDSIYDAKYMEAEANAEIDRIDKALSVVNDYVPEGDIVISEKEYTEAKNEIDGDLSVYCDHQERLLEKVANLRGDQQHLLSQLTFAREAVKELDLDYKFSVENIDGDVIECPICGTEHDNSIVSRSGILGDKQQLEFQVGDLEKTLGSVQAGLIESEQELVFVRSEIDRIEDKYSIGNDKHEGRSLIDAITAKTVRKNVGAALEEKEAVSKRQSEIQKHLKKEQKGLVTKRAREDLDASFMHYLTAYVNKLNARRVNLSNVNKPTDYNKVFNNGGAAHSCRAILAYHLAVYSQSKSSGVSVTSPLVVDTPNQHEQTDFNYESIVNLLVDGCLGDGQIILCAMDNELLKPFSEKAKIITLNKDQLFKASAYDDLKDRFDRVFSE